MVISQFQPPVLVRRVDPPYTALAGSVQIRATVSTDGVPTEMAWAGGDNRLTKAAIGVIKRWRYKPALLNGRPVESQIVITVEIKK